MAVAGAEGHDRVVTGDVVVPDPETLARAAGILRDGGLVAFPTETVYGLGADATNPDAVARIFATKGRPVGHPLIVHLGTADLLDAWADEVPPSARLLADAFWPGPLTLILRRTDRAPDAVTGGRDTVGLRVPDHPVARALLEAFGGGIAAPSANRYGRVSPTTAAHVRADLGADVDLVLDGGPCTVGVESTIIDCTGSEPEVLRAGGVGGDRLAEVLGGSAARWSTPTPLAADPATPRAPGMVASHYAPDAVVEVVTADTVVARSAELAASRRSVGVLAPRSVEGLPPDVVELEPAGDAEEFARLLYGRLRQADRLGLEVLLVVAPPAVGVGVAVADRLRRAAGPRS
jgi:L-threonylcarbamoyladenylate synthase